jgi:hypothetical protein
MNHNRRTLILVCLLLVLLYLLTLYCTGEYVA